MPFPCFVCLLTMGYPTENAFLPKQKIIKAEEWYSKKKVDILTIQKSNAYCFALRSVCTIFVQPLPKKHMKKNSQVIFDRNVIEFVTVAVEFCKFIEQSEESKRSAFVDTILKLLPLLYLKTSMLPPCEILGDEAPETFVTEETYEIIRMNLAGVMGNRDDYLDVFVSDMKYSDQPITRYISEDLADIYQDIKDFVFVFQLGLNETMNDSLAICQENFRLYWGQKLVNTLRALHEVKYHDGQEEDNEEIENGE